MRIRFCLSVLAAGAVAVAVGQLKAAFGEVVPAGGCTPGVGPDVVVGDLSDIERHGTVGPITAYSIGTTSCNLGDQLLEWDGDSANHPVIAQSIYRLHGGRFEQIGISWLKHGFATLDGDFCCTCTPPPNNQFLGVGCSDPYGAGINGQQTGFNCGGGIICGGLGPRWQVNASTGVFTFPYDTAGVGGNGIFKRLQVRNADLDPELNSGALYFGEGQYVTPDDAAAGNQHNNASCRQLVVGSFENGGWNLSFSGPTESQRPAIIAWQTLDPEVTISVVDDQSNGRFQLGSRVTQTPNRTWHYEYALFNMNSHRCAREFVVPVPAGVTITNTGFHDVDYHSGDGEGGVTFDGTDWSIATGGAISWSTQTQAQNPNANALRWGTLYNFRFDADTAPATADITIGLFRPGSPMTLTATTQVPSAPANTCPWDLDDSRAVATADLLALLAAWGPNPGHPADFDNDGVVGTEDLLALLANWGPCP